MEDAFLQIIFQLPSSPLCAEQNCKAQGYQEDLQKVILSLPRVCAYPYQVCHAHFWKLPAYHALHQKLQY